MQNIHKLGRNMKIGIIGDSSCDLTQEMKTRMGALIAPLKVTVEDKEFVDDDTLDLQSQFEAMRASKQAASSACPSPEEFASLMKEFDACFVITLSSKLSGSYNAAEVARELALEEHPEKKIHVVDSLSASAGQVADALFIEDMINDGKTFDEIVDAVEEYKRNMRTLFVLENLETFVKNGRLGKVAGLLATTFSIRPILSDNGAGEIVMQDKVRGTKQALIKMVEHVADITKNEMAKSKRMVISHCNAPERAEEVKKMVLDNCEVIAEAVIVSTHGLSSVYANEGGIIVSF